jgi:hypothetical protein
MAQAFPVTKDEPGAWRPSANCGCHGMAQAFPVTRDQAAWRKRFR